MQACLFNRREVHTCFPPRSLGVLVVNSLVICATCRARPRPNLRGYYSYLRPSFPRPSSFVLFLSQQNPSLGETSKRTL